MDLAAIEIFARVVEAKGFSAAARRLNLSKSAVSKHVTRLEKSLGVRLLNRSTRCVSLTEIGREFYERCADILAAAEQAELAATRMQAEPRGTLRVTSPVAFGIACLAALLPDFLRARPGLAVDLTLTNRAINLVDEGYDLSVVIAQELQPGVVARRVAAIRRTLCAAPAYIAERGMPGTPDDLHDHNCVVYTGDAQQRKWCLHDGRGTTSVTVAGNFLANNFAVLHQSVLRGVGVGLLPDFLAAPDVRRGALVKVLPEFEPDEAALYCVYTANRHVPPKVRAFVDFLISRLGPDEAWSGGR